MAAVEYARGVVEEITNRRWRKVGSLEPRPTLVASLLTLIRDTRLYLITSDEDLIVMWDNIRKDPELTDFLLMSAVEFKLRAPSGVGGYNEVIERLAVAYGSIGDRDSVIDSDTVERLPNAEVYRSLLKHNGWFLFLLLLETSAVFEDTRPSGIGSEVAQ